MLGKAQGGLESYNAMRVRLHDRVGGMVEEIGSLASRVAGSSQELSASPQQTGVSIGEIASIADQTNLLALNAAIEAARAGNWSIPTHPRVRGRRGRGPQARRGSAPSACSPGVCPGARHTSSGASTSRSRLTQRPRVGPMLPIGIPIRTDTSA